MWRWRQRCQGSSIDSRYFTSQKTAPYLTHFFYDSILTSISTESITSSFWSEVLCTIDLSDRAPPTKTAVRTPTTLNEILRFWSMHLDSDLTQTAKIPHCKTYRDTYSPFHFRFVHSDPRFGSHSWFWNFEKSTLEKYEVLESIFETRSKKCQMILAVQSRTTFAVLVKHDRLNISHFN